MAISYRPATETDLAFIISTWVKGSRKAERHVFMSNEDYFTFFRQKVIKTLSSAFVRVAYEDSDGKDDPDTQKVIAGYAVYTFGPKEELRLHQVYVRKMLWGLGIARGIIKDIYPDYLEKPVVTTALFIYHEALKKNHANLHYNPYWELQ